ncbi:MAG: VacJ family lipoprotein [Deltaproteobacteria bacterium]|nr:VacJ family lipoprotein [Deltaproteobacteria bacterium]
MSDIIRRFGFICCMLSLLLAFDLQAEEASDPFEGFNRSVYEFNDVVDRNLLEPVARRYSDNMPPPFKKGISNFLDNLLFPRRFVSSLVQFKIGQAFTFLGRFVVNTATGFGGLLEVADSVGLKAPDDEDFGLMLAYYDLPAGPYLVLPFLGPSNFRDAFGRAVDFFLSPTYWLDFAEWDMSTTDRLVYGYNTINVISGRASLLEAVEAGKEASLDFYSFSKSSYYQHRDGLLYDGFPPDDDFDSEFEDEFDDEN